MGQPSRFPQVILGTCCWLLISLFLLLPLGLLFITKCIVIFIAATVRRDLYSISTGDAAFAVGSTWKRSKVNVGFLLRIEGTLELSSVQKKFSSSLLEPKIGQKPKHEKLHSCLVTWCGFVFRRLIPIDLSKLDQLIYIKPLGSKESLEELMDKWLVRSYRENAPAWEMILIPQIPNYSCSGSSISADSTDCHEVAIAFKIHHAMADGYSLLHILDTITGNQSPYLVKDPKDSLYAKIADVLTLPVNMPTLLGDGFHTKNPLKVPRPQNFWNYSFTSIDLRVVKSIRKRHNVHFASVLLALIAGAIRQYLLESEKEESLPSHLSLLDTLPWPNHPRSVMCNHWTLAIFKTPIRWDDPLKRLLEIEQCFINFHIKGLQKCAKQVIFPLAWLAPQIFTEKLLSSFDPGYNSGLTSLVGADDYTFLGKAVSHIHPLLNFSDSNPYTGLSWFTFTQSNKIDVSLAGAPDLFRGRKALERILTVYFKNEIQKLCNQCGVPNFED